MFSTMWIVWQENCEQAEEIITDPTAIVVLAMLPSWRAKFTGVSIIAPFTRKPSPYSWVKKHLNFFSSVHGKSDGSPCWKTLHNFLSFIQFTYMAEIGLYSPLGPCIIFEAEIRCPISGLSSTPRMPLWTLGSFKNSTWSRLKVTHSQTSWFGFELIFIFRTPIRHKENAHNRWGFHQLSVRMGLILACICNHNKCNVILLRCNRYQVTYGVIKLDWPSLDWFIRRQFYQVWNSTLAKLAMDPADTTSCVNL